MPRSLKELLGFNQLVELRRVIKKIGGVKAAIKQRYLIDQTRAGDLVGVDKFGNKYYEDNSYFMPRNRYWMPPDKTWLDYDASQIPPEWHRWLHHTTQDPPNKNPVEQPKWVLEHQENVSLDPTKKYVPYSTTRPKVLGWQPGQSKHQPGEGEEH